MSDLEHEGEWIWNSDHSKLVYSNWFSSWPVIEPDNGQFTGCEEDCGCVAGRLLDNKWHDYNCDWVKEPTGFHCEGLKAICQKI